MDIGRKDLRYRMHGVVGDILIKLIDLSLQVPTLDHNVPKEFHIYCNKLNQINPGHFQKSRSTLNLAIFQAYILQLFGPFNIPLTVRHATTRVTNQTRVGGLVYSGLITFSNLVLVHFDVYIIYYTK